MGCANHGLKTRVGQKCIQTWLDANNILYMVNPRIESSISRSQNLDLGTCIMKPTTVFLVCFVGIAGSVIRQILSAKKHGASSHHYRICGCL